MRRLGILVAGLGAGLATLSGCRPDATKPLGPPDSYLLFAPATGGPMSSGLPVAETIEVTDGRAQPLVKLFTDGFASEMLRTAYLAKQLVREMSVGGRRLPPQGREHAHEALGILVGVDRAPYGRGLALRGWVGEPVARPGLVWLGFADGATQDKAFVQTVAGRLAVLILH